MSSIESAGKFLQKHGVGETPDKDVKALIPKAKKFLAAA
jgi:hypothetical protein